MYLNNNISPKYIMPSVVYSPRNTVINNQSELWQRQPLFLWSWYNKCLAIVRRGFVITTGYLIICTPISDELAKGCCHPDSYVKSNIGKLAKLLLWWITKKPINLVIFFCFFFKCMMLYQSPPKNNFAVILLVVVIIPTFVLVQMSFNGCREKRDYVHTVKKKNW